VFVLKRFFVEEAVRERKSETGLGMALWEWALVAVATGAALLLGVFHLDLPSLWHDELVHLFVGRSIAETGWPTLPGREFFPSYLVYHVILAG
jgi:hypothetical protein